MPRTPPPGHDPGMEPALHEARDHAYAHSWEEEMRRAVDQRNALPRDACEALVRVLESFLVEDETVGDDHHDELVRAIALLREPRGSADRRQETKSPAQPGLFSGRGAEI
jgi:hypothetical protein